MRPFVRFAVLLLVVALVWVPAPAVAFRGRLHDAAQLDARAAAAADAEADASGEAWASTNAMAIAQQMNDDMLHDLLTGGDADGQVGIECELQSAPRVVVAALNPLSNYEKTRDNQGYVKAQKKIEEAFKKYDKNMKPTLEEALVMPQYYSKPYLQSTNYAWGISTDNERGWGSTKVDKVVKGKTIKKPNPKLLAWWVYQGLDEADLPPISKYSGLSSAMELVSVPLNTDLSPLEAKQGIHANSAGATLGHTTQAMRIWVQTLKKFMLPKAKGGLAEDHLLKDLTSDEKKVFQFAFADTSFNNIQVVVPLNLVLAQFKKDITDYDNKGWRGLSDGYFLSEYEEEADPFHDQHIYKELLHRYLCFPLMQDNAFDRKALRKVFKFSEQVNFGFPVANFAARAGSPAGSLKVVQGDQPYNDKSPVKKQWRRFTAKIWEHLQLRSFELLSSRALEYDAKIQTARGVVDEHTRLSEAEQMEVHGYFTLLAWYYFLKGHLGLREKFNHQILIKASVNDVLRALSPKARRVISHWLHTLGNWGLPALSQRDPEARLQTMVFSVLETVSREVWANSKVETELKYPAALDETAIVKLPDGKGGTVDRTRKELAKLLIINLVQPVLTDAKARWKTEAPLAADSYCRVGEFNDKNRGSYPPNRWQETPVGKRVDPFKIHGKAAVLLEHRGGSEWAHKWVSVFLAPAETPEQMTIYFSDATLGAEMRALQTPLDKTVLIEMLHSRRRGASSELRSHTRALDSQSQSQLVQYVENDGKFPRKAKHERPVAGKQAVAKETEMYVAASKIFNTLHPDAKLTQQEEQEAKKASAHLHSDLAKMLESPEFAKRKKALAEACKATGDHAMSEPDKIAWSCSK